MRYMLGCHTATLVFLHCCHGRLHITIHLLSVRTFLTGIRKTRSHIPGHKHGNRNTEKTHLIGECKSHSIECRLASTIERLIRYAQHCSNRRSKDDTTVTLSTQNRQHRLYKVECSKQIHIKLTACFTGCSELYRSRYTKARIGNNDINMVTLGTYLADSLPHRRLVGNIAMYMHNAIVAHTMPTEFKHLPTMLCKELYGGKSNPRRTACQD